MRQNFWVKLTLGNASIFRFDTLSTEDVDISKYEWVKMYSLSQALMFNNEWLHDVMCFTVFTKIEYQKSHQSTTVP